jgi:hypothetical protein
MRNINGSKFLFQLSPSFEMAAAGNNQIGNVNQTSKKILRRMW